MAVLNAGKQWSVLMGRGISMVKACLPEFLDLLPQW